jgi:hypothetical protein
MRFTLIGVEFGAADKALVPIGQTRRFGIETVGPCQ